MTARRRFVLAALATLIAPASTALAQGGPLVDVYKSATCGCCGKWVEHLRANGFTVRAHDVADPARYRAQFGVPAELGSCHTGVVAGYALEGHVPAREVKRLLTERPAARGLAVPAMPLGSPGMEAPRAEPYQVLLIDRQGRTSVYARYPG